MEKELAKLAAGAGLRVNEDAALSELVVYLNEYPSAILGSFDPSYLELREEILICLAMQKAGARRGMRGCYGHVLRMQNFSGKSTKDVGSPTICPSWRTSPFRRSSAPMGTRSNAFVRCHDDWRSNGSRAELMKRGWLRPIAQRSWRNAIW